MSTNTKQIFRPDLFLLFTVFVISSMMWPGCTARIEGCLDIQAANFELNAEQPCSGCCTYPLMKLSLSQKWNDRNFSTSDTLYDIHQQAYKIQNIRFFLSAWSWRDGDGNQFTTDQVAIDCGDMVLNFTPDILLIDSKQFAYTLGTIRQSPPVVSLQGMLGLSEDFSCLDQTHPKLPIGLKTTSPLWNSTTSTFETVRLIIQQDLMEEKSDTVFMTLNNPFQFDYSLELAKGFDGQFKLTLDYARWFQDVDLSDLNSFRTSLLAHFPGSIFPTP